MSAPTQIDDPTTFFKDHFSLPPLPGVVHKLLAALDSDKANARSIAELLSSDVGLVAQILKIVNSAYYGLPTPIRDVKHAVAYLGLGEIKRVTLTVAVMDTLAPRNTQEFERFWYHSFFTALAAKAIARRHFPAMEAEELHVSALLHDIGKLVYMKFFPDHYEKLDAYRREHGAMFREAELRLDLPGHAEIGASLCDRWMLPEAVKRACLRHELEHLQQLRAETAVDEELVVISAANLLTNLASEELREADKMAIRDAVGRGLDFGEEEFLLLMGELYEMRSDVQGFLRELR